MFNDSNQSIELLIDSSDKEALYKSIKLYQNLEANVETLSFLEKQLRRFVGDERCSELDEEVENIFNELNFKSKKEIKNISNAPVYEFDINEVKVKLKQAIKEKNNIEIEYFSVSQQTFKKYNLRPDQISSSMLDAYDLDKKGQKVLRLNRIKSIKKAA